MKKKMKSMIIILLVISMLLPMCNIQSRAAEANWLWPVPASRTIGTWYSEGGHDGLDIWGAYNTPIVASKSGTVVKVLHGDELPNWEGYGNGVVINHGDGYYSHYAHMASVSVSQGQYVSQGQQIGCMGSSGNSTGTHLHFAIATRVYGGGGRINNNPGVINYIYSVEPTITPATLSCTAGNSASATKFSWNGGTDCEFYSLRIFRKVNGTYTDTNSVWNLKTRSHNVVLPAGDYRAYVDCVIGSNYKASNEVYFTVKSSSANLGQSFDARILQSTSKCPIGVEQEYKYDVKLLASNRYVEEYWHFERQSDGSYVIKSLYNGDVLDCANAGTVNCTNVCTFRWHEHDAQRWYIYSTGDGYYYLGPKHAPNLLLDVYSDRNVPGLNVQLYERNDRNKKFIIEKSTVIPIKTLALSNHTLAVGNSVTLSARKTPSNANMTKLTWSSSNPSVATVDSNGMVKAKKVGTTKITVTSQFDKRISAQATITVQKVITAVKGDADGDGKVSVNDALTILMHIAGKNPKNYFEKVADCDGTAGVTVSDALAILMHIAGKKTLGS